MGEPRILFHDPDPRVLRIAERALRATGAQVDAVADGDRGRRLLDERYDLVMLNFDPPIRADPRWADALPRVQARLLFHATAASVDYLPLLAERGFVRNLIAKNDAPLDPDEIVTTAVKLLRGDLFGADKYLAWGASSFKVEIRDSREKHACVQQAAERAARLGLGGRVLGIVEAVADELVTNALFGPARAPALGRAMPRLPVVLDEPATLEVATDGSLLALAQSDGHGTLSPEAIARYLNRLLIPGVAAEVGLGHVFPSLWRVVVNVDPGRRTEVIALLDVREGMRKMRQLPKSFHVFVGSGSEVARA